jgi:hypothetical protein
VWDDDDFYFPHALHSIAWACERAPWCMPSLIYLRGDNSLVCHNAYGAADRKDRAYHSSWAFRRELLDCGLLIYPSVVYFEDRDLGRALIKAGVPDADPCERYPAYAVYDPYNSPERVSRLGGVAGWWARSKEPIVVASEPLVSRRPTTVATELTLAELERLCAHPRQRPWKHDSDWLERRDA